MIHYDRNRLEKKSSHPYSYCFAPNKDGFRCWCALGGVDQCIRPDNPIGCKYQILDEELICSADERFCLRLLVKDVPPEREFWLVQVDGEPLEGNPFSSRTLAIQAANRYFAEMSHPARLILRNLKKQQQKEC